MRKDTLLLSIMYATNETETMLPIRKIRLIARPRDIVFPSGMVQASGKIDGDVKYLHITTASFSGHKAYAPKGMGFLSVKEGLEIDSAIHGGSQEGNR